MEYKKGFQIKPSEIQSDGTVLFTDGTDNVHANQLACEAYGYKYNAELGICKAYDYTSKLSIRSKETKTDIKGTNNTVERGVRDTLISGKDNIAKGENQNSFISGEKNEIERGVSNAVAFGKMSKPTHKNEFTVGGGGFDSEAGLLQMSVIQLSRRVNNSAESHNLYIDGDADDDNTDEILLPANSVVTYEIWLSALVTGGSSGTAGDYEAYVFLGVIRTTNDGTMAHNAKIDRLLGRTGSLGTQVIDTDTPYTLRLQVAGLANVNIQYHAVAKLHINKTNVVEI